MVFTEAQGVCRNELAEEPQLVPAAIGVGTEKFTIPSQSPSTVCCQYWSSPRTCPRHIQAFRRNMLSHAGHPHVDRLELRPHRRQRFVLTKGWTRIAPSVIKVAGHTVRISNPRSHDIR